MLNRQNKNTVITVYRYFRLFIADLSIFVGLERTYKRVLSIIKQALFATLNFLNGATKYSKSIKL